MYTNTRMSCLDTCRVIPQKCTNAYPQHPFLMKIILVPNKSGFLEALTTEQFRPPSLIWRHHQTTSVACIVGLSSIKLAWQGMCRHRNWRQTSTNLNVTFADITILTKRKICFVSDVICSGPDKKYMICNLFGLYYFMSKSTGIDTSDNLDALKLLSHNVSGTKYVTLADISIKSSFCFWYNLTGTQACH